MPGSGIHSRSISSVLSTLYPIWHDQGVIGELHLSAGGWTYPRSGLFRREGMGFGLGVTAQDEREKEKREWGRWKVRGEELAEVRRIVDQWVADADKR
jgi:hypothetical protein